MADRPVQPPDDRDAEAARLHESGQRHYERGEYAEARKLFEYALALRQTALGDDDLATAQTLGALALVLAQQGDPAGAQPMIERTLAIRERIWGPNHPETAEALNNLGFLRRMQGDNEAARSLYEQALAIRERTLGPDDPLTANSLSNLGVLAAAERNYRAARRYHERALGIYERVAGPDDLQTGRALNNLATVLAEQGDREAALPLLSRSLAIHERTLAPQHPAVANVLNNIADLYKMQREYAAAQPLYERALIIRERALGAAHPRTAETVRSLVGVYTFTRDFTSGIPLNRISQALQRSVGHPDIKTIDELHRFVERLEAQANRPPLSPDDQQALAEAAKLHGQADAFLARQDYAGAQAALEQALMLREETVGPDDLEQVPLLQKLGAALQAQGEYERLRPVQERIVEIHVHTLGDNHPMTLSARTQLMSMQADGEGIFAALPAMQQIQAVLQQQVEPDTPLAPTIHHLGALLEQFKTLWERQAGAQGRPPDRPAQRRERAPSSDETVGAVLAGLDDVPWRMLRHAYGPATDVPGQIKALLSVDEHTRERALYHLHTNIWHQGTVYEATAYAVPFLIKLLEYSETPDRASIAHLLAALAGDDEAWEPDEYRWSRAAHEAAGAGLPLYLDLLGATDDQELRAAAVRAVMAFPERPSESVPRLQILLAVEQDRQMRVWLVEALGKVMDASAAARAYFEDALASADDPSMALVAAAALADRAGEATPERAVDALVEAVGSVNGARKASGHQSIEEAVASLQSIDEDEAGIVELAVQRLFKLGERRGVPALFRALRRTVEGDAARTVAEALLDLTFNAGRIQGKSVAISRLPDGRLKVSYWEPDRLPERAAATLSAEQRVVLEALAAHDPFWEQEHDLLALYGLPMTREGLRAIAGGG